MVAVTRASPMAIPYPQLSDSQSPKRGRQIDRAICLLREFCIKGFHTVSPMESMPENCASYKHLPHVFITRDTYPTTSDYPKINPTSCPQTTMQARFSLTLFRPSHRFPAISPCHHLPGEGIAKAFTLKHTWLQMSTNTTNYLLSRPRSCVSEANWPL